MDDNRKRGNADNGMILKSAAVMLAIILVIGIILLVLTSSGGSGGGSTVREAPALASSAANSQSDSDAASQNTASAQEEASNTPDAGSAGTETVVEEPLSDVERFIKSLDGWWINSMDGSDGVIDEYYYYHDGTEDYYSGSGAVLSEPRTLNPDQCVYISSFAAGPSQWNGGPGWFIESQPGSDWGVLVPDSNPNSMVGLYKDGHGFTAHYVYDRVEPPSWASNI